MGELLQKDQIISVIPQNFKNANKGKIIEVHDNYFLMELFHVPEGIFQNKLIEFYSQTKNGMLYFISSTMKIEENTITVKTPLKHRFLQRREFSRIKITKNMEFKSNGETYNVKSIDLSAGGMKLTTKEHFDIDAEYDLTVDLSNDKSINPKFIPIRIEKNEDDSYTLSGRFSIPSNADKISLMQYCMNKNVENVNK